MNYPGMSLSKLTKKNCHGASETILTFSSKKTANFSLIFCDKIDLNLRENHAQR